MKTEIDVGISTGLLEKVGENGSKCGKFRIIVFLACESTYLFDIHWLYTLAAFEYYFANCGHGLVCMADFMAQTWVLFINGNETNGHIFIQVIGA